MYKKRPLKAECSVSPLADFLGAACHASGQSVRCSASGIYFNLHGNALWNSDFSVLSGCFWQEMRFMNANDTWLEPTTGLSRLHCRGRLRAVCQQRSSCSPLGTTGLGERPRLCLGLTWGTFGTEVSPSTPNTSNKYRQTLGEGLSTKWSWVKGI